MANRIDNISHEASTSRERYDRSRSRGRAEFTRGSVSPAPRNNRSSSRATFLGRPRQRTFQIYEADESEGNSHAGAQDSSWRWRSESRTVRDSLDTHDDDGFVFSDEEHESSRKDRPRGRRMSTRGLATTKPQAMASKQTSLSADTARSENTHREDKYPPPQNGDLQPSTPAKDVEAQPQSPSKTVPRLSRVPYPISHFLGYRTKETENRALVRPVEKLPRKLETLIWAFVGAMLGLSFVMITFSRWPLFAMSDNDPVTTWTAPIVIGSFGASSVILYGTPASPLGQPKAFIGGQFISALVSVCITKLFRLDQDYNPTLIDSSHSLVWIAGGVATATALCAMILTDTVHPPGGATALLGATSPPVVRLGWKYLAVVLLSGVIMQVWAMLWMNLGRAKYPTFWLWPPNQPPQLVSKMLHPVSTAKQKSK